MNKVVLSATIDPRAKEALDQDALRNEGASKGAVSRIVSKILLNHYGLPIADPGDAPGQSGDE